MSMVGWNGATQRLRLHDLARVYADSCLHAAAREKARQRHAEYYLSVLREADDLYLKGGKGVLAGLGLADREWASILTGQMWAAATPRRGVQLASDYPDAGTHVLGLRLHPAEKIRWRGAALDAARQLRNRAAEGAHLGNLGLAYADLGQPRKAIEFYEQQLAIAREIGNRRGEGNALGNLGNAYADLGQPRKAIEFYEQQLAIAREIGDRRGEAIACWNMGDEYAKQGDLKRAVELMQVCMDFDREIGHPDAEKDGAHVAALRQRLADGDHGRKGKPRTGRPANESE
jgi:tetratricopeptide (TPR) repeat protein